MLSFFARKKGIQVLFACSLIFLIANHAEANGKKDCYTCSPDYVPGMPVVGDQTLGELARISYALLNENDFKLMSNLSSFCKQFSSATESSHLHLRKKMISEMEKISLNGDVAPFFVEAGCNPQYIAQTKSPMSHLASEIPEAYMKQLDAIRNYFFDIKKPESFTKMLNAKNTKGHTTLDYVEWLLENKKYDDEDKAYLGKYRAYLCSNGAVYSTYKSSKSCNSQVASSK